jgi:small-conductance mechanosensitive channel
VRLTFGSDFEFATGLCVASARQALQELIGEPDPPPFTRVELLQWGVLLRVRYRTTPSRRQEVSSRVTELIWEAFREHPDRVRFSYPASVARVPRRRSDMPPAPAEPAPGV